MSATWVWAGIATVIVVLLVSKSLRAVCGVILMGAAAQALGNQVGVIGSPRTNALALAMPPVASGITIAFLLGLCLGLAIALVVAVKLHSGANSERSLKRSSLRLLRSHQTGWFRRMRTWFGFK